MSTASVTAAAGTQPAQPAQRARPHVYELDRLRVMTALSVVAVHVLGFTAFLERTPAGVQVQDAFLTASHFTREVFMFVTALALVYVYAGRPFDWRRFWQRRSIGVLVPYAVWTLIYVWLNAHPQTLGDFVRTSLVDLATAGASYQLYYILLTLQFYLILPLFLWVLDRVRRHPWTVLAVSFALQVVVLYLDYRYVESPTPIQWPILQVFARVQDSFVLMYQFYFVLGALVALHLDQARAFLARHGRLVILAMGIALAALWAHYYFQVQVEHLPLAYATVVLQPMMALYCVPVIAFLSWIAYVGVRRVDASALRGVRPATAQAIRRHWATLSDATFGIYLVHPLFLSAVLAWVIPRVGSALPAAVSVVLTWVLTASAATGFSIALMRLPIVRGLVGRSRLLSPARPGAGRAGGYAWQRVKSKGAA